MKVISRPQALKQGLDKYFSGGPCKNGQIYFRSVGGRRCLCKPCQDERKERDQSRYNKDKEKYLAKAKAWRTKNAGRYEYLLKRWQKQNREHVNEQARAKRAASPERYRAYVKSYVTRNPKINAIKTGKRRAAKILRTPNWANELTDFTFGEAVSLCFERTAIHGFEWHVDHAVPMQSKKASGLHTWSNLQVIPAALNTKKGNRLLYTDSLEWLGDAI